MSDSRASAWVPGRRLLVSLVGVGVVLRLIRLVANRSFWVDEIAVALNLRDRSWSTLWEPLDYHQVAPPGFLLVEKLAGELLGYAEWSLRLYPWVASVAALLLFTSLARRLLSRGEALVAVTLFAVLEPLVHFSAELKPYGTDLFFCLLLPWLMWGREAPDFRLLGIVGCLGMWFSTPLVFVAAALVAAGLVAAWKQADRELLVRWLWVAAAWLGSFLLQYALVLREPVRDEYLQSYWSWAFPGAVTPALPWTLETARGMFLDPGGLSLAWVAGPLFLVGVVCTVRRGPVQLAVLLGPTVLCLLAAGLRLYPFATGIPEGWEQLFFGRLLLFLVPGWLLLIARGAGPLLTWRDRRSAWPGAIVLALLIGGPIWRAARHALDPPRVQAIRPVLAAIETSGRGKGRLLVHELARLGYRLYARGTTLDPEPDYFRHETVDDLERLLVTIDSIPPGIHFWTLLYRQPRSPNHGPRVVGLLRRNCTLLETVAEEGITAHLWRTTGS